MGARRWRKGRAAWCLAMLALAWIVCWAPAAQAQTPPGRGYLDQAELPRGAHELTLSGWAASERSHVFVHNLIVLLGDREVYRGRLTGASVRPDVVAATGRAEWLGSGFRVRVRLPAALPAGSYPLVVQVRLGDGEQFTLESAPGARTVQVPESARLSRWTMLALLLAAALPLAALAVPDGAARRKHVRRAGGPGRFALAGAASFALLVASGTTGSSLALLLTPPAVTEQDFQPGLGEPRVARSDEWQVFTPLALAQAAHQPRFPVINRNLGADGKNMLVLGMSGVAVAHPSALAKPATWGFFLFDGRHALAWAWWLPIWGGLGAAWLLLQRMFGLAWRPAAALAACLVLAPYSVAFSYWPAYLTMFLSLGLCAAGGLLRSPRWPAATGWGLLLGWSMAAFALVLYPAWQVSLATLALPLGLAWGWRERALWRWNAARTLGLLAALLLAGGLLLSWWTDAREAVVAMQATVYPGQRASEAGGDIDRWFLLKGWLNPLTLHVDLASMMRVDAASFQFLWLPTLVAVLWQAWRDRRPDPVALALLGFAAFALTYQFLGLPAWLTRLTFWNVVTSYRLDLALGVAQLLLLAWLMAQPRAVAGQGGRARLLPAGVAALTLAGVLWQYRRMPLDIADGLPAGFVLLSALAAAAAACLMLSQRWIAFLALYLGWTLAAALPFHPLGQAPQALRLTGELAAAGLADGAADAAGRRGVAVVGERNWAMTLPAAGVPVVNSLLYYPQPSLWRRLDPDGRQRDTYNRYQRLMFELRAQPGGRTFSIESPRLDEVRVELDPSRFDFRLLGARWVITPAANAEALVSNGSLEPVPALSGSAGVALYRVR